MGLSRSPLGIGSGLGPSGAVGGIPDVVSIRSAGACRTSSDHPHPVFAGNSKDKRGVVDPRCPLGSADLLSPVVTNIRGAFLRERVFGDAVAFLGPLVYVGIVPMRGKGSTTPHCQGIRIILHRRV